MSLYFRFGVGACHIHVDRRMSGADDRLVEAEERSISVVGLRSKHCLRWHSLGVHALDD